MSTPPPDPPSTPGPESDEPLGPVGVPVMDANRPNIEKTSETIDRTIELRSLEPLALFGVLDLTRADLRPVRAAVERGSHPAALAELREHFRQRFPLPDRSEARPPQLEVAHKITRRILQWGPYEEVQYGPDMDWAWDPRGDIEWVAAMYRFYWAGPLVAAYASTRHEQYARTFVELTEDWIRQHPLQEHGRIHPVYTYWHGFAWLDLQTGIRVDNLCTAFRTFVHSEAFTPEFLGVVLASLYDHQVKSELIPMGVIHNKAIFEQRGFIRVADDFPEFCDASRWLALGARRTCENLLAQTTTDGVQREWSFGYHSAVLHDAVEIAKRLEGAGLPPSAEYRQRVLRMHEYVFGIASPDLATPMFGDGSRKRQPGDDRATWPLHSFLIEATDRLGDPKYAALAHLDTTQLPEAASRAFPEAGIYALRSGWDADALYLALHCSPKAISSHDQPDNGTFELRAFGRWLMPDTGFYYYGHDPEGRAWHRRTAAHQTLTLGGADCADAGRHLLWHAATGGDALAVENDAYPGLAHRRTLWFPGHAFFVILDEAIGDAAGALDLHFQLAPGDLHLDRDAGRVSTTFPDANVLIAAATDSPSQIVEEEGWTSWEYGLREPRPALRFQHPGTAPAIFLTVVVPYRGTEPPSVQAALPQDVEVGADRVEVEVTCDGQQWLVGRDLGKGTAWCRRETHPQSPLR